MEKIHCFWPQKIQNDWISTRRSRSSSITDGGPTAFGASNKFSCLVPAGSCGFNPLKNKITQYRILIQKYGSNEYNIVLETPAPLVFVPLQTLKFKTKIHTHPARESRACSHLVGIFFSPRICLTNPKLGKWDLTTLSVLIAGWEGSHSPREAVSNDGYWNPLPTIMASRKPFHPGDWST